MINRLQKLRIKAGDVKCSCIFVLFLCVSVEGCLCKEEQI